MKLTKAGSKNFPTYYVQKSVRINGKSTTKTVERLGSLEELIARFGEENTLDKAHEYVKELTKKEKEDNADIMVKFSPSLSIQKDEKHSVNVGYLFLQDIYYDLGIDKILKEISERHKFKYDLNDIFSMLVYMRILFPSSKRTSLNDSKILAEQPKCELHQVYRALEIIAEEDNFIQAELFKNTEKILKRKKEILYYDCTNYYFEIEQEGDIQKYGLSKEHRPNPIVQMGLFMDRDGIPLAFSVFNGNENEQGSLKPLEKQIIENYGIHKFIVCTDSGLSSMANRKYNSIGERAFVTTQSIKKLKKHLKDYCLDTKQWKIKGSNKKYDISEIDEEKYYDTIFYKDRWINENDLEQHLIVTYSVKQKEYQRSIREKQINRAEKLIANPSRINKKRDGDPKRLIDTRHCTKEGEMAETTLNSIDRERIEEEQKYDGFYAVCTNLEDNAETIIEINKRRWKIEECFRIMKTEFKARPVYLSKRDRITAHFTTCFTALVIYRILEKKLETELGNNTESKYTTKEILTTLQEMNMHILPGYGYTPSYTRTELTDTLHDIFGFKLDKEIITNKNMKKIFRDTKN